MSDASLILVSAARWCSARYREYKLPLLTCLILGLMCHMYAFTNKLVNHDEVNSLFIKGATVDSGRWGLGALDTIFPNYSMPWIYGILTLLLIACSVCLMIRILSIGSGCFQALLAGAVVVFPSLTGTLAYMFTSSSFALSFFLAVLAVYLLRGKPRLCWAVGLGCMVFSLSIYQSYISLAAGLLVVALIGDLLRGEDVGKTISRGVGYVLFLAASLGIYYGLTQIILVWKDVSLNPYASGNLGFSLAGIPTAMGESYVRFLRFFTEGYQGLMPTVFSRVLHLICLGAAALLLLLWCFQARNPGRFILVLALTGLLPLAVNCMYLFTTAESVHTLVLYGFVCVYAFVITIADSLLRSQQGQRVMHLLAVNVLSLAMALILVGNIYLANQVWLNLHLRYENAYAFYTSLLSDIRAMPAFGPDSRLALIGDYQEPDFYEEQFSHLDTITGVKGFLPDSYSKQYFLEYYLGVSIPFLSEEETAALSAMPEVAEMPVYPYYGSIAAIGDTIVVKLSE